LWFSYNISGGELRKILDGSLARAPFDADVPSAVVASADWKSAIQQDTILRYFAVVLSPGAGLQPLPGFRTEGSGDEVAMTFPGPALSHCREDFGSD
jgi:hypothetical protein